MDNFAPVLIPTLNRHVHFKRCVESLSKCTHAEKTDLFIALDYPLTEARWEGYEKIKAYLPRIKGFKSVQIIERHKNFGARENVQDARKMIFETYDRMIFSEDDNEFSYDFLNFINQGLEVFRNRKDIFSICGYQFPVVFSKTYENDIYVWQGFSAWGVGIWREKFLKVDWSRETVFSDIRRFLNNYGEVYRHFKVANHFIANKMGMVQKNEIYGDAYLSWYLISNKMYSVFPTVSRVRNTGHDGSGLHCGNMKKNPYKEQNIYTGSDDYVLNPNIQPHPIPNKFLYDFFKLNFKRRVKLYIRFVLYHFDVMFKNIEKRG